MRRFLDNIWVVLISISRTMFFLQLLPLLFFFSFFLKPALAQDFCDYSGRTILQLHLIPLNFFIDESSLTGEPE